VVVARRPNDPALLRRPRPRRRRKIYCAAVRSKRVLGGPFQYDCRNNLSELEDPGVVHIPLIVSAPITRAEYVAALPPE
jgi:hypothetical protein